MMHLLSMGRYARFVWPSYGLALAVFVLNLFSARRALRRAQREARARQAANP